MNFSKYIRILVLVLLPACLICLDSPETKSFEIPKPTGQHTVGTQVFYLTDTSRQDPETGKDRQLVMQAWYPAITMTAKTLERLPQPDTYAYEFREVLKRELKKKFGPQDFPEGTIPFIPPYMTENIWEYYANQIDTITTHAYDKAPIQNPQAKYPVVVVAHGYGTTRGEYSALCEEIASQGYIVLMVMQTYITALTRFADGTETEILRERSLGMFTDCLADIEFLIDSAQNCAQCGDFQNIGIVGHSLGGMMASHVCRLDTRVKAGISLDAPLYGPGATEPFHKPFMFMIAPTFYETFGDEEGLSFTDNMTKEEFAVSLETFCQENGKDSYKIVLKNADHCTFTDAPILTGILKKIFGKNNIDFCVGTIDGAKAIEITRAYVCSFFDKYLKEKAAPLLDKANKKYAADVEFNSWLK